MRKIKLTAECDNPSHHAWMEYIDAMKTCPVKRLRPEVGIANNWTMFLNGDYDSTLRDVLDSGVYTNLLENSLLEVTGNGNDRHITNQSKSIKADIAKDRRTHPHAKYIYSGMVLSEDGFSALGLNGGVAGGTGGLYVPNKPYNLYLILTSAGGGNLHQRWQSIRKGAIWVCEYILRNDLQAKFASANFYDSRTGEVNTKAEKKYVGLTYP